MFYTYCSEFKPPKTLRTSLVQEVFEDKDLVLLDRKILEKYEVLKELNKSLYLQYNHLLNWQVYKILIVVSIIFVLIGIAQVLLTYYLMVKLSNFN